MRKFLRLFALIIAVALAGCGATLPKVKPYKMDIQQGNVVTSEMLLKLRPGMSKSQVKFIMGTPLLVDSFHTNRWDYFYQLRKQGKIVNQRRVILDFEDGLLKRVRGDVVPKGSTAEDVTKQLESASKENAIDKPVGTDDDQPVIVPLEVPAVEPTDVPAEAGDVSLGAVVEEEVAESDAPASVLAVPIPMAPVVDAPVKTLESELPKDKAEILDRTDEVKMLDKLETEVPMAKPMSDVTAKQVDTPIKALVGQPANARPYNDRVFRLDHQLDTSRIKQKAGSEQVAPTDGNAKKDSVVKEINDGQDQTLSNQESPSFFERMLEKIGF